MSFWGHFWEAGRQRSDFGPERSSGVREVKKVIFGGKQ